MRTAMDRVKDSLAPRRAIVDLVRSLGREIGATCDSLVRVVEDARVSFAAAPGCHLRVLEASWADASANGEKFV